VHTGAFRRMVLLMVWPDAVWRDLSVHPIAPRQLFLRVVVPFAIVIALAHQIGWTWLNASWSPDWGHGTQQLYGSASILVVLFSALAAPTVLAAQLARLAPMCGGRRDFVAAFNVAIFGTLPVFLAASTLFFMPMVVLCLPAFGYSCFLYAQGVRRLLGVSRDDGAELVVGALLALTMVMTVASLLLGALVAA